MAGPLLATIKGGLYERTGLSLPKGWFPLCSESRDMSGECLAQGQGGGCQSVKGDQVSVIMSLAAEAWSRNLRSPGCSEGTADSWKVQCSLAPSVYFRWAV